MKKTKLFLCLIAFSLSGLVTASPIAGGYTDIAPDSPEVDFAARYLVNEVSEATGLAIDIKDQQQAAIQVVAGTNIKLCLSVVVDDEASRHLGGVVYRPLSGGMILSEWTWAPSCRDFATEQ